MAQQVPIILTLSDEAFKGFIRATTGMDTNQVVSQWAEQKSLEWTERLKGELEAQMETLMGLYFSADMVTAATVKGLIDQINSTLNPTLSTTPPTPSPQV